jgi:hypothetical protein
VHQQCTLNQARRSDKNEEQDDFRLSRRHGAFAP